MTAGEEELAALPPGKDSRDKFPFGVYSRDGQLVGYFDLVRDFPKAGVWTLGLLMLAPGERARGLGTRVYDAAARWAAARGAGAIELGVLEQNPDAERFWRRQGFREVRRQAYTSDTGQSSRLVVLRHRLLPPDAA